MELWGDTRREHRPQWTEYLHQAELLLTEPRKPLPQDVVSQVLAGDLQSIHTQDLPNLRNKIVVFVSSTFTDTKAERNTLMKDVYPYLRSLCRILGLDFGSVDMRWGVNEDTTLSHATTNVCVQEIERCMNESAGPAFLAIVGNKYGYRPFPSEIASAEYTLLRDTLVNSGADTSTLEEYFQLDTNMVPAHYVLKPRSVDQKDWWPVFETIQCQLRSAADQCMSPEEAEKYHISVTEQEITTGLFQNKSRESQVTIMRRMLGSIRDEHHRHRHVIDVVQGDIDEEAQQCLQGLREKKLPQSSSDILDFEYEECDETKVKEYVKQSCDSICKALAESILENYGNKLHVGEDEVFSEVMQHRQMAIEKCNLFVGREDLIGTVEGYVKGSSALPFVVHGRSGCGKTALMAWCALRMKELHGNSVIILRFLGTTATSAAARALLQNTCKQISRAYNKDPTKVPTSYKDLIVHFRECLGYATSSKPLYIFLDSLDQLSNEDFGRNLKWLSLRDELPKHVRMVVSTLPGQCLDILTGFLPNRDNFQEVHPLTVNDGAPILEKMLSAEKRTLTDEQRHIVLAAFNNCPLPLYLRLAVDVALRWHSYDAIDPDELAEDMPGLITTLFRRLENKYGKTFVHHALAYITIAKNGLSVAELEDILSCDDDVLREVFSYWTPPFIRIPPLLWIRIRNELGSYLVERGSDGVNTYGWYHRQFWETAQKEFIDRSPDKNTSFEQPARTALANHFEGKWYNGKEFCDKKGKKKLENRQVASQPLAFTATRNTGRKLNKRKLSELSHQLLNLNDWAKFKKLICNLDYVEGKFSAEQGYECVSEFIEASKIAGDEEITAFAKFIGSSLSHLLREPEAIFQLASQQVAGNPVRIKFESYSESFPLAVIRDMAPDTVEDPCLMTLRGHTSGIRSCTYSPNGELIASCAEDGSLRVWDAFSGAEIVTVTGLPGPTYPGLADPYHGERPCAFSRDGLNIATGSEDGWLQIWDLAGAQIHGEQVHSSTVTGVVYSPDNNTLVSTSKDQTAKFWDVSEKKCSLLSTVSIGVQGLACDYSPDGCTVCISGYGSFVTIDVNTRQVITSAQGYTNLNLSACYSPSGGQVASGGDNSNVTLWDGRTGQVSGQLVGHKGWVWSAQYSPDGSHVMTCSSDRTMKVWKSSTQHCIVTLGGHLHRVSCVSIAPNQQTFVTGSLDFCLKVWDYHAVVSGNVPAVGGLHYTVMMVSPDRQYIASSQGWSTACTISAITTGSNIASTQAHSGFLQQVDYSPDSQLLVSVDTGHSGQYSDNAVYNARVIVSSVPSGERVAQLTVTAPCSLGCREDLIIVGTYEGEVCTFNRSDFSPVQSWRFTDSGSGVKSEWTSITAISCTHGAPHVAVLAGDIVKIWNVSDSSSEVDFITEITNNGHQMNHCLYSPDNTHLATSDINGAVNIWRAKDGYNLVRSLPGHVSMIRDMAFSPDGSYLATVAVEMSLRVWDVNNGFTLKCVWYGPVNQVGFSQENTLIIGEATGNKRTISF